MSDNGAVLDGYTVEKWVSKHTLGGWYCFPVLVKPDTDTGERFRAWDMDNQCYTFINGWAYEIDDAERAKSEVI